MIDQQQRLQTLVRDELAKIALANGIDKSQVGFYVGPSFAPQQQAGGQVGIFFAWIVNITLRVPLLGYPAISYPVVIPAPPGMLPTDNDFRGAAKMGLENAAAAQRELMQQAEDEGKT